MIRCDEQNERFIDGSVFGDGAHAEIFWALHLGNGSFDGGHASSVGGREAPVRTEPRPTILSDALILEAINGH
jgi:hypothetical protein